MASNQNRLSILELEKKAKEPLSLEQKQILDSHLEKKSCLINIACNQCNYPSCKIQPLDSFQGIYFMTCQTEICINTNKFWFGCLLCAGNETYHCKKEMYQFHNFKSLRRHLKTHQHKNLLLKPKDKLALLQQNELYNVHDCTHVFDSAEENSELENEANDDSMSIKELYIDGDLCENICSIQSDDNFHGNDSSALLHEK